MTGLLGVVEWWRARRQRARCLQGKHGVVVSHIAEVYHGPQVLGLDGMAEKRRIRKVHTHDTCESCGAILAVTIYFFRRVKK